MPDTRICTAAEADLPAIVALVNSAYRGDSSRVGWTTEADYIDGQRTSLADLARELAAPGAPQMLILREGEATDLLACVMLEMVAARDGGQSGYIGMLTVAPHLQDKGVGRRMLEAAENEARRRGADRARMSVVSIRGSLIAWYERRGYVQTGERTPFPYDDQRFGLPQVAGLEFVILEKPLIA